MENWKAITGFEGLYEVSDRGRVRRLSHVIQASPRCGGSRLHRGRLIQQQQKSNGYLQVCLCKDGGRTYVGVHRLVAEAFLAKDAERRYVNHKNGVKTDNRVDNLEWCTAQENMAHARGTGLMSPSSLRKRLLCPETGETFASSYQAAEWVNVTHRGSTGDVPSMSRKIRAVATGKQKTAYGFHWKDLPTDQ